MKIALKLTMDGLMRALRTRAHRLAEEIEAGRTPPDDTGAHGRPMRRRQVRVSKRDNDGGGD